MFLSIQTTPRKEVTSTPSTEPHASSVKIWTASPLKKGKMEDLAVPEFSGFRGKIAATPKEAYQNTLVRVLDK